jgi:hypothetical protein
VAKLEIQDYDGPGVNPQGQDRQVKVTLSRRNLLTLLHKLDMPGSARRIENNVVYVDGELNNEYILVLCCEDDEEHYADPDRLGGPAGRMHPDSEAYVRAHTQA